MGNAGRHIPNILRKNRKINGCSQTCLAKFFGMKKSNQISQWEKGITLPSLKNAILLCILFKIHVEDLYDDYFEELQNEYKEEIEEFWNRIRQ